MIVLPLTDGTRLAIIASRYKSEAIIFPSDGSGQQRILVRDPRRVYIRFRPIAGPGYPRPYPGMVPALALAAEVSEGEQEYKAKDSPGLVSGEWYIFNTVVGDSLEILTDTYIGR